MNTREIAKEYRIGHWSSILQERNTSGMSVRSYCQQSGIRENVYYYWQRKLREAACLKLLPATDDKDSGAVVPSGWAICEAEKTVTDASGVIIEAGGCRVVVGSDVNPELLEKVLLVLKKLC